MLRILLFALALCACAPPGDPTPVVPTPVGPTPLAGATQDQVARLLSRETRTVLTDGAAQTLAHQCSRLSPGPIEGSWAPNEADLDTLETGLASLLAARLEALGIAASPGEYYRQYAGFIIGGRRIVYVNGVAARAVEGDVNPEHPFDWRREAIGICDGGPVTFGVEYDPATGQFRNFAFNGSLG